MFGGRIARGLVDAGKPVRALVPDMLVKYAGMSLEQVELGVLVHYRAWKRGDADLVTDTVEELTGRSPMTTRRVAGAQPGGVQVKSVIAAATMNAAAHSWSVFSHALRSTATPSRS
jgi:hypothetical protein